MNNRILLVIGFTTSQLFITDVNLQEVPIRRPWIDINWFLHNITDSFLRGNELQNVINKECRLNSDNVYGADILNEITRNFRTALQNNICILRSLKRVIENEYSTWEAKLRNETNSDDLCSENRVEGRDYCVILPPPESNADDRVRAPFVPQRVNLEFSRRANRMDVHYVAFDDGSLYVHSKSPNLPSTNFSSHYDSRLRYFYTQTKSPGSRELMIVVDRRNDTNKELLKEAVEKILKTLRPTDKVALCLPFNNTCKTSLYSKAWSRQNHPLRNWSFSGEMYVASNININRIRSSFNEWLNSSINRLDIISNYTKTLSSAHDLLKQGLSCHITKGSCCQKLILVTSRSEHCEKSISEMFSQRRIKIVCRNFCAMNPTNVTSMPSMTELPAMNTTNVTSMPSTTELPAMNTTNVTSLPSTTELPAMNTRNVTSMPSTTELPAMNPTNVTSMPSMTELPAMNTTNVTSMPSTTELPAMKTTNVTSMPSTTELPAMKTINVTSMPSTTELPVMNTTKITEVSSIPSTTELPAMNETHATYVSPVPSPREIPGLPLDKWDESDLFCESNSGSENPVVTMPYVDGFGNGYIISICLPLANDGKFSGVVCSDLNFVNLESKIAVEGYNGAYAFMVNSLGYTLMHPLLPPSYTITEDRTNININNLEQAALVGSILDSIIQQSLESQGENYRENDNPCNGGPVIEPSTVTCRDIEGVEVKSVGRPGGSNIPGIVKLYDKALQYCWTSINNTDLTIALVLPRENSKKYLPLCEGYNPQDLPNFRYYHQLNSTEKNCHIEQGQSNGSMIFSPDCFLDVASYVQKETLYNTKVNATFNNKEAYTEFMRKNLHGSVNLLRRADQLWTETVKENNRSEEWNRYMGTADGALVSFLGKCFHKAYDHRNTPWYHRAVPFQHIDYISMSNPYFSECENRTVVTISRTLYDQYENPVAVVAADFPLQDIIHEFHAHVPNCTSSICILVDNAGYVVFKSDWKYIEYDDETVASHIIRIASDIAWDMIGNYILQRRACHDYEENLTFYYWSFALKGKDTVYDSPMYTVHKITHTSLFLIVRKTGATRGECNCGLYKKGTDLECHDTCASECECPCKAGNQTIPCHNADRDVHRYPVPACKPLAYRGIMKCSTP